MMTIRALAAAAAIFVSGAACAVGPGDLGAIDNTSVTINNTHLGHAAFVDTYLFDVSGFGLGVGVVFDFTLPKFDIEFSSLSFVDLTTNTTLATDTDGSDGWAVGAVLPGAHEYAFEVAGTPTGQLGGVYLGIITTFVPTPVPEPSTYAMLLAGLGVVGFVGRRRKQ
jgi:hypothetical protein